MSASEMGAKSRAAPEKAIYRPHSRQFGPSDSHHEIGMRRFVESVG